MHDLKKFLDDKVDAFNGPDFIADDPISIPHRFTLLQDIEISAFFAAIFAWGGRRVIVAKASALMELMDNAPYQFILGHRPADLRRFESFRHRTFNTTDLLYFIEFFAWFYARHNSLEEAFLAGRGAETALNGFYHTFFSLEDVPDRTRKHIAAPEKNASCKRLNMFLRWMVRNDGKGVDFGLWRRLSAADLICPVDLHVARVARYLGLMQRPVVDWKAALELTENLRSFDPADPVKYDFALFGLGVMERYGYAV